MNRLRREKMHKHITEHGSATVGELKKLFPEVSVMTIHRDLDYLELNGLITRVRGGALASMTAMEPVFTERERENSAAKDLIAQKAAALIRPGSTVFLDAGTTALAIASHIPDIHISVFTIGPNIALELLRHEKVSVNLCGGNLNRDNLALSGRSTLAMLAQVNIDIAFIGTGGYTAENGFTGGREDEARTKKLVIKKARTRVAVMDSSKVGRILPFTFARLEDFEYVVGDGKLPEELTVQAAACPITIL